MADGKFAIVTGASRGIGLELAKLAQADGYDLLLAADRPFDGEASALTGQAGVETLEVDLSTIEGVDKLLSATAGRKVDALFANAGRGLGEGFLDQSVDDWRHVIDTNITGTAYLLHHVLGDMVRRNDGKVLVTGSIAGYIPGGFQAVYNASKAFVDSFVAALQNEIKEADGVTLTNLMPGPVETEFFHRAGMDDTGVGAADNKSDPADVAKDGYDALMAGKASIVSGWKNKIQAAVANITPNSVLAEQNRKISEPGSAD